MSPVRAIILYPVPGDIVMDHLVYHHITHRIFIELVCLGKIDDLISDRFLGFLPVSPILEPGNYVGPVKQFDIWRRQRIVKILSVTIPEHVGQCVNVCFHIVFVVSWYKTIEIVIFISDNHTYESEIMT